MLKEKYLHGFSKTEQERLMRQARFLENYVYADIDLSSVDNILEVGSGVGAQTEILLRRFPNAQLSCIDFSESQIATAKQFLSDNPVATGRYEINQMDATDMDFLSNDKFDGAFYAGYWNIFQIRLKFFLR